jgi:hypothetical protein
VARPGFTVTDASPTWISVRVGLAALLNISPERVEIREGLSLGAGRSRATQVRLKIRLHLRFNRLDNLGRGELLFRTLPGEESRDAKRDRGDCRPDNWDQGGTSGEKGRGDTTRDLGCGDGYGLSYGPGAEPGHTEGV